MKCGRGSTLCGLLLITGINILKVIRLLNICFKFSLIIIELHCSHSLWIKKSFREWVSIPSIFIFKVRGFCFICVLCKSSEMSMKCTWFHITKRMIPHETTLCDSEACNQNGCFLKFWLIMISKNKLLSAPFVIILFIKKFTEISNYNNLPIFTITSFEILRKISINYSHFPILITMLQFAIFPNHAMLLASSSCSLVNFN